MSDVEESREVTEGERAAELDAEAGVLRWLLDVMCLPLGDPDSLGDDSYVVTHGDHQELLVRIVYKRALTVEDDFYKTVPRYSVGSYQWPVCCTPKSEEDDLVEVMTWKPDWLTPILVSSRYVLWDELDPLTQDLYDQFRRQGLDSDHAKVVTRAVMDGMTVMPVRRLSGFDDVQGP